MRKMKTSGPPGGRVRESTAPALAWLPDALTWVRLGSLPVLWTLALLRLPEALAVGATAAASTDLLDGFLARRLRVASPRGGALDSRADHLLSISLVLWLAMLRPDFFREQRLPMVLWAALALGVLAVGWMRRAQPVNLHLYSAKAAAFTGYAFGLLLLFTGTYSRAFFAFALALASLAAVEALLVIVSGRADRHGGSILLRARGGDGVTG